MALVPSAKKEKKTVTEKLPSLKSGCEKRLPTNWLLLKHTIDH